MNSAGKWRWLVQRESWGQKGSIEQEPDQILDSLVASIGIRFLLQLNNDWVFWVDLHCLLWNHVVWHGWISGIIIKNYLKAWAFMILSMLADHPYSLVTRAHGDSLSLCETWTFSILSPKTSLQSLQSPSKAAFCSSSFFFSSSVWFNSSPSLEVFLSLWPSKSFNCWRTY